MDDDFYSSGSSSSVGDPAIQVSPSYVQRAKQQTQFFDQVDEATPEPTINQEVSLLRLSQVGIFLMPCLLKSTMNFRFMIGDSIKVMTNRITAHMIKMGDHWKLLITPS